MRFLKFYPTVIMLLIGSQSLFAQSWQVSLGSYYVNAPVAAANGSTGFTQLWHDNAVIWKYGNASVGGALRFGSANNLGASGFIEHMRITDGGSVCIGGQDPKGYKLAVNGNAIFTKVVVKSYSNWPDYVFTRNYRLRPLSEIEQYINLHHHLPEVASAEEVKTKGLDLIENQAALLKKIEELTLYIIEQDKRIQALEKKIQAQ